MKTKKGGIYAALTAAVLILITILITACLEPITSFKLPEKVFPQIPEDFVPTPGKGVVQFVIADEIKGRLINTDVQNASGFEEFDLYVYNDNGAVPGVWDGTQTQFIDTEVVTSQPIRISKLNLNKPLELPDETVFFFKLDAYQYDVGAGTPGAGTIAATGMSLAIEIEANAPNTVSITLTAVGTTGTGDGKFLYKFKYPVGHGLDDALLTVRSLTTHAVVEGPTPIADNPANFEEITLPADYYRISVEMTKDEYQTAYYSDTLYIYEGMTSTTSNPIQLPDLKGIVYNLVFNFNDTGTPNDTSRTTLHGTPYGPIAATGTFLNANPTLATATFPTPNPDSYTFAGWFTTLAAAQNPAANAALKVDDAYVFIKNNLTLFAGWTAGTILNFTPSYAPITGTSPPVVADSPTSTQGQGIYTIIFTPTNPDRGSGDYRYFDFSWDTEYNSTPILIEEFTLTINNTTIGIQYKAVGTFWVDCTAKDKDNGNILVTTRTFITVTAAP